MWKFEVNTVREASEHHAKGATVTDIDGDRWVVGERNDFVPEDYSTIAADWNSEHWNETLSDQVFAPFTVEYPDAVETPLSTSARRKAQPMARGCLDYFPSALAAVAELSRLGNDKHNPGEEMHHARSKSSDHADCIVRHLVDRGTIDPETGLTHTAAVAWRALALLQEELEAAGAPKARGAK